ncbi:MAG: polyhydroxyalkanoic acid system family protein [Pirellulales bacterium]|jgi:hypothetical protein|nr:polyhydroxyalkanoic acid system family protein [Pirellulales bacterium]HJN67276.1 polyhydroxyalkanoic acid system family protein [Pirellulales bacterium]|tara:strand:+ start:351 stop:653 length:303 start_codon:yes stop_codon:yes gene_type:complete
MPTLQVTVSHQIDKEGARERLQRFIEDKKHLYGDHVKDLEETWDGHALHYSFSAKGFKTKGILTVEETHVVLDGTLPFAAMLFRGRIEQDIRTALTEALA